MPNNRVHIGLLEEEREGEQKRAEKDMVGKDWYLETIVVEEKDGGRQGMLFIREHSGCAQGLHLRI